jgi:hypothetical protein
VFFIKYFKAIISRRIKWAEHAERREQKLAYRSLVGKSERLRPIGRSRSRWRLILRGFDLQHRQRIFPLASASRPALKPTQPIGQCVSNVKVPFIYQYTN